MNKTLIKTVLEFDYNGQINLTEYSRPILNTGNYDNINEYEIEPINDKISNRHYIMSDNLNKVIRKTTFNGSMEFSYYHIMGENKVSKATIEFMLVEEAEKELHYRERAVKEWKENLFKGKINVRKGE